MSMHLPLLAAAHAAGTGTAAVALKRHFTPIGRAGASLLVVASFAVPRVATAQTDRAPSRSGAPTRTVPRTQDGRPDLQGVWSFALATPLQRPGQFADKPVLTDAEAAAFLKGLPSGGCRFVKCDGSDEGKLESAYGDGWYDAGAKLAENRTSLIVDPPNGTVPALTTDARTRIAALRALDPSRAFLSGPEQATLTDRCLVGFNSGPPMNPSAYNNMVQIFQTSGHVVILNEMVHNARIVPLDGRPHLSSSVRQWVGDSRGRWDGDTLVVETTNFRRDSLIGPSGNTSIRPETFRLIERFTRTNTDTLHYEYTMSDPQTWTAPWTVRIPMMRSAEHIYEYACHEGNYSMAHRLSAARAAEGKTSTPQRSDPRR